MLQRPLGNRKDVLNQSEAPRDDARGLVFICSAV